MPTPAHNSGEVPLPMLILFMSFIIYMVVAAIGAIFAGIRHGYIVARDGECDDSPDFIMAVLIWPVRLLAKIGSFMYFIVSRSIGIAQKTLGKNKNVITKINRL